MHLQKYIQQHNEVELSALGMGTPLDPSSLFPAHRNLDGLFSFKYKIIDKLVQE